MTTEFYRRLSWKMLLLGILAALLADLPELISGNDLGAFLVARVLFIAASIILLIIAAINARRKAISSLVMLAAFCGSGWMFLTYSYDIHTTARWFIYSWQYKAEVLAQPQLPNGELKHIEWDGWGMAGSDTIVYLVYHPEDRLTHDPGLAPDRFSGIPCPVWWTRRIEPHWDYVVFYTNTGWGGCS